MEAGLPNNSFLEKLEEELMKLPSWKDQEDRKDSWMTSSEIAKWSADKGYGQYTAEVIETFLLDKLKRSELNNIRPAKYPHLRSMHRLWGHKERVYQSVEVEPWKTNSKIELDEINLPEGVPKVFLSHSEKDFELAKQIRQTLGENYGLETWLFEKELDRDENIFGSVHLGIVHCNALAVLLTSNSIGSAWILTEIENAGKSFQKKIITLIDSHDEVLLLVIDMYLKNPVFSDADVKAILERYKLKEKEEHRINNFYKNAKNILQFLHLYSNFAVYPAIPAEYSNGKFIDLEKALQR